MTVSRSVLWLVIGLAPGAAYSPEIVCHQTDRLTFIVGNDRWRPVGPTRGTPRTADCVSLLGTAGRAANRIGGWGKTGSGGRSPGDVSHSLTWAAVSSCLIFLSSASCSGPGLSWATYASGPLAVVVRREWQPRHLVVIVGSVAIRTWHAGTAAGAGARPLPRPIRTVFAGPAAIRATEAFHWEHFRLFARFFRHTCEPSYLRKEAMEHCLVRRDQFNISPQGIVHKPTDASFTPDPSDPFSGTMRLGQLCSSPRHGGGFRPDDVRRIMRELWVDYVVTHPHLFNSGGGRPVF